MHILGSENEAKAMEVTDESAFHWSRYVQNQWIRREIEGPGIVKAWAARFRFGGRPTLVIRRKDNTYCGVAPCEPKQLFKAVIEPTALFMLDNAPRATTPWLQDA